MSEPNDAGSGTQLVITIDTTEKERFLATSEVVALRNWTATEAELYAELIRLYPGYTLERFFHEAAKSFARRKIAEAHSIRLRGLKQRPGSADKRLERAYKRLLANNAKARKTGDRVRKVTAWTIADSAIPITSWRVVAKWVRDNNIPVDDNGHVSNEKPDDAD